MGTVTPTTLEELAALARIDVAELKDFTETDFEGLTGFATKLTKKACHLCKGNLRLSRSDKNCNNPQKTKNQAGPEALPFHYNMKVHPGRDLIYFR